MEYVKGTGAGTVYLTKGATIPFGDAREKEGIRAVSLLPPQQLNLV